MAVIVRLPLSSGLLSGKMSRDTQFGENDHRNYNRDGEQFNVGETFSGLPFEKGVALADTVKPLVPEGMTMAQMALRWVLDFEAVSVVIPGARTAAGGRERGSSDLPASAPSCTEAGGALFAEVAPHIRGRY